MIAPAAAVIRDWSKVNLVCDGNSYFSGAGASTPLPSLINAKVGGAGKFTNLGVSGQTWRMMDGLDGGTSGDVDSAYVAGMINVLVCAETTNQISNVSYTASQTIAALQSYVANRLAAHPGWLIVMGTACPRQNGPGFSAFGSGQTGIDIANATIIAVNNWIIANARSIGVKRVVDYQQPAINGNAASPFLLPDFSPASLATLNPIANEQNAFVHPNDAGYAILAGYFAAQLRRMPVR